MAGGRHRTSSGPLIQGVHDAEREDEVTAAENGRADGAEEQADADAVERS